MRPLFFLCGLVQLILLIAVIDQLKKYLTVIVFGAPSLLGQGRIRTGRL